MSKCLVTTILSSLLVLSVSGQVSAAEPDNSGAAEQGPNNPDFKIMLDKLSGRQTKKIIYRDLILLNMSNMGIEKGISIVVNGARIEQIVPSHRLDEKIMAGAEVYDASGLHALPGLIDSHVHLATLPDRTLAEALSKRYLYSGITAVRDMAGDGRALADLARAARINDIASPDIYYSALMAGPEFFQDPRTYMSSLGAEQGRTAWLQAVDDDTDLALAVGLARGSSASAIKIYKRVPGLLTRKIIAEAHRQGFRVWSHAHVPPGSPFDAVQADSVSHVCMIASLAYTQTNSTQGSQPDLSTFSVEQAGMQHYFKLLANNNTFFDATMRIYRQAGPSAEFGTRPDCSRENAAAIVMAAHQAGVRIVAGTDGHTEADDPFPALIEEMEDLVDIVGLSTGDVIRSATVHGAMLLGLDKEMGTVENGKLANFILVKDNPLEDISHLRSLVMTVKRGLQFPRAKYTHQSLPEGLW